MMRNEVEMEKPLISIIVPIYNMEKYLDQSLESIRSQTFREWECLLVDDGSTDRSNSICRSFADSDSRFRLITKPNGGVSSARNEGLRHAEGEFIGFVDPDDWIEPGMFERLFHLITDYRADMAQVGYWREYRGRRSVKHLVKSLEVIDGTAAMREIAYDRLHNYLWNRLHRRSIITCLFPEGRVYEDIYVYGKWLRNVGSMVIDPEPFYHYRMRKGSIVHESAHRFDFFQSCVEKMRMMSESAGSAEDTVCRIAYIHRAAVNACKIIAREEKDESLRMATIARISGILAGYPLPSRRYMGLKTWWRSRMLRNDPVAFCRVMRAVHILDFDSKHRMRHLYD